MFRCLYGDLPLRDTDVNVVITSVMVFVLLPHRDLALDVPDWAQRPEGERAVITAWLAQLKKAAMLTRYIRFPAFGLFDRERVDPAMLAAVTAEVGQSLGQRLEVELVERTLETMVVIVPSGEAEKYFVHDMWGHGWQETLLDFEWFMDDLALLGKPIGPTTGTRLQEGEVTLAHAFAGGALHRDKLCAVVEANLRARIQRGLNVVVAENLADLIEHKFTRQRGQDRALPSSSLLPESTLKIDLSLQDVRRMVGLWARPWRRLFTEREDFERLRGELIAAGVPAAGLDAALGEALATIAERFGAAFEPNLLHPGDEGPVPTTVLGRVLLGVVSLDGALTKFLADGDARFASKPGLARWQCPPACVDLLALVLGYVYEQNRELNIWHLDELLRNELWPALVDLEAAIAAELAA